MTIAVAGYGYVGRAIHNHLSKREKMAIVDPVHSQLRLGAIDDLKGVIVCVPTPENEDGSCDASIVDRVISEAPSDCHILIKSTVSLTAWVLLEQDHDDKKLCYSPEFLRAATAESDVINTDRIILAGTGREFWLQHYCSHFKNATVRVCDPREAIAAKYFTNAYLAAKVSFFNQMHDFCTASRLEYEAVRSMVGEDRRIGHSHTYLNDIGQKGWGGACFPKDTSALLAMAKERGVDLPAVASAVDYNGKQQ